MLNYFCACPNNYVGENCETFVGNPGIVPTKPSILQQPKSTELFDFATPINLTCTAEGHPTPTYQWHKDGYEIPGEIRSFLYISDPQPSHRGNYTCVASNSEGSTTSEPAQITISGNFILYPNIMNFYNDSVYYYRYCSFYIIHLVVQKCHRCLHTLRGRKAL